MVYKKKLHYLKGGFYYYDSDTKKVEYIARINQKEHNLNLPYMNRIENLLTKLIKYCNPSDIRVEPIDNITSFEDESQPRNHKHTTYISSHSIYNIILNGFKNIIFRISIAKNQEILQEIEDIIAIIPTSGHESLLDAFTNVFDDILLYLQTDFQQQIEEIKNPQRLHRIWYPTIPLNSPPKYKLIGRKITIDSSANHVAQWLHEQYRPLGLVKDILIHNDINAEKLLTLTKVDLWKMGIPDHKGELILLYTDKLRKKLSKSKLKKQIKRLQKKLDKDKIKSEHIQDVQDEIETLKSKLRWNK